MKLYMIVLKTKKKAIINIIIGKSFYRWNAVIQSKVVKKKATIV